ncbi:hypothetical protein C8R46DRAFT_1352808 [Mycena filopes]|nr:hypothetical protein C8R46DRAFT_1352808 [Mycena filopes]
MDSIMPPPLPSNLSPETRHVKALIEASEANIARIESQIRDLESLRDRERETLARLQAALRSFAAPVRKLPVELLAEIFRYVCVFDPYYRRQSRRQRLGKRLNFLPLRAAEVMSHVCAHWRQVAITTPQLWTEILPIGLDKTPTEDYCAGLKDWLGRSAPLPIHVGLSCTMGVDATAVAGAFLTTADRWSDANLALPSLSVFSQIPSDGIKQLRNLTLNSPDRTSASLAAFSLAPNLTEVTLYIRHIARLQLPWSQLAHLTVGTESPQDSQECLDTLLLCQNLVTAYFSIDAWPGRPDVSALTPVTLGKLERLEISSSSYEGSVTPFFASLALPALSRLNLSLSDIDWATPEFTQFQLRSPNIETLTIGGTELNSDDLMTILRHAPTISELTQNCPEAFDETIATALSASHQNHAQLVPQLRDLVITHGFRFLADDVLHSLVAARWWTDEQLATFPSPPRVSRWSFIYIKTDDEEYLSPELEAKLEEYREQGLDVDVGNIYG